MVDSQPGAPREPGLLAALRRLGATALALAETRIELIATELQEERLRLLRILMFSMASLLFLALGVVALTVLVILLAWENHRVLAAALLTASYLGIAALLAVYARSAARKRTKLFSATIAELRKDRDGLS